MSAGASSGNNFGERDLAVQTALTAQSSAKFCDVKLVLLVPFPLIISQVSANKLCKEDLIAALLKLMYVP
jgi:hypothetical protein